MNKVFSHISNEKGDDFHQKTISYSFFSHFCQYLGSDSYESCHRSAMVKNTEILTVSVVLGSIKDGNTADSNPNISTAGSNNSHVQILKKGPYL